MNLSLQLKVFAGNQYFVNPTSGNHTPGTGSYSDLVDDWAYSVCTHSLILKSPSKAAHISLLHVMNACRPSPPLFYFHVSTQTEEQKTM